MRKHRTLDCSGQTRRQGMIVWKRGSIPTNYLYTTRGMMQRAAYPPTHCDCCVPRTVSYHVIMLWDQSGLSTVISSPIGI